MQDTNCTEIIKQESNRDVVAIEVEQTKALTSLATSMNQIASFITQGGLVELMSGMARANAVKDILGGLATHDGRAALDARVLPQNALEIVAQVEQVFKKYEEKLSSKERVDDTVHDAENDYMKWKEGQK